MRDWLVPAILLLGIVAAIAYFGGLSKDRAKPDEPPAPAIEQPALTPGPEEEPGPSVEALRDACIEEIKQRRMPRYNEPSACHRYEDATRGTLPAARPAAPPASSPSARSAVPAEESPYATIYVDQCTQFKRGSIDYRSCRHRESERIRRECARKTRQAEEASGAARKQLRREAAAYCREQSRYRPVD